MNTQDFVCSCLGLTRRESDFIDKLGENFPRFDITDDDVYAYFDMCASSEFYNGKPRRLQNFLISCIYNNIIDYFTDEDRFDMPLDVDLFVFSVDSVDSSLIYDGKVINNENELFDIVK